MKKNFIKIFSVIAAAFIGVFAFSKCVNASFIDTSDLSTSPNLLVLDDKAETTSNGITYSSSNGIITINGTSTDTFVITWLITLNSGTYSFNKFDSTSGYNAIIYTTAWNWLSSGGTYTFDSTAIEFIIRVVSGYTFDNTIIKPMLVEGSTSPTSFVQGGYVLTDSEIESYNSIYDTLLSNYNALVDSYNTLLTNYNNLSASITDSSNYFSFIESYVLSYDIYYLGTNNLFASVSVDPDLVSYTLNNYSVLNVYQSLYSEAIYPNNDSSEDWGSYGSAYYVVYNLSTDFNYTTLSYIGGTNFDLYYNGSFVASSTDSDLSTSSTSFTDGSGYTFNQIRMSLAPNDADMSFLGLNIYGSYLSYYYNLGFTDGYNSNQLMSDYNALNNTYTALLSDYNALLEKYNNIVSDYAALQEDYQDLLTETYTFSNLFWSISLVPFGVLSSVFNIEVLGVNLFALISGIISAFLVIWLLKKILKLF